MGIKIGQKKLKKLFIDNKQVNVIYKDKDVIYTREFKLVINLGIGVSSADYTITSLGGNGIISGSIYNNTTLVVHYGDQVSIRGNASNHYVVTYDKTFVITSDKQIAIEPDSVQTYTLTFSISYAGKYYKKGPGSLSYSINDGSYIDISTDRQVDVPAFTKVSVKYTTLTGFTLSNYTVSGSTDHYISPTFSIDSVERNMTITAVVIDAEQSYAGGNAVTFLKGSGTASLSIKGFNATLVVSSNDVPDGVAAGTPIAKLTNSNFSPTATTSAKSSTWCNNSNYGSTTANISINTKGEISSDADSKKGSAGGGGKWGSWSVSWSTSFSVRLTYTWTTGSLI